MIVSHKHIYIFLKTAKTAGTSIEIFLSTVQASFAEFLESVDRRHLSNFHVYSIDGEVAVDRVCFYENLLNELNDISVRIGAAERITLPEAKKNVRPGVEMKKLQLGEKEEEAIAKACFSEIDQFGYRFA